MIINWCCSPWLNQGELFYLYKEACKHFVCMRCHVSCAWVIMCMRCHVSCTWVMLCMWCHVSCAWLMLACMWCNACPSYTCHVLCCACMSCDLSMTACRLSQSTFRAHPDILLLVARSKEVASRETQGPSCSKDYAAGLHQSRGQLYPYRTMSEWFPCSGSLGGRRQGDLHWGSTRFWRNNMFYGHIFCSHTLHPKGQENNADSGRGYRWKTPLLGCNYGRNDSTSALVGVTSGSNFFWFNFFSSTRCHSRFIMVSDAQSYCGLVWTLHQLLSSM
jgi:hypothetical protein